VRRVEIGRAPIGLHADRRHEIEAQQREVDEVVAREGLVAQVRVHEAQAAEAPAAGAEAPDLGQVQAGRVAHEDVLDVAAPPDEEADLPLDLARQLTQVRRELRRRDLAREQAPPVDALERVQLAGREARRVSRYGLQRAASFCWICRACFS
jgi:hypothetical protein